MIAAINLYQLAGARPTIPGLRYPGGSLLARDPETGPRHDAAHGLFAKVQAVKFMEFFARQRGAEISVSRPDELQSQFGKTRHQLPVAAHAAPSVSHTERAFSTVAHQKPATLPVADLKQFCRAVRGKAALDNILNDFNAVNLFQRKYP